MCHPGPHVGNRYFPKWRKPGRITEMFGNETQITKNIRAIGGQGVTGGGIQRLFRGQPCRKRVTCGRRDMSYASQRRIVRSKTPAKKARRSVPWVGLN